MTTIDVDFNNVTTEGRLKVNPSAADGQLTVGARVMVHDELESISLWATVRSLDADRATAILDVNWDELPVAEPLNHIHAITEGVLRVHVIAPVRISGLHYEQLSDPILIRA